MNNYVSCPQKMRGAVRRFCLQQQMMADVIAGHRDIFRICQTHGFTFASATPSQSCPGEFPCNLCDRRFANAQALQGHKWKWHGQFSEERKYIFDAVCRACGKCWWTPQRLQQHLKHSRRLENGCFYQLQQKFEPLGAPISFVIPEELQRVHRLPRCIGSWPVHIA